MAARSMLSSSAMLLDERFFDGAGADQRWGGEGEAIRRAADWDQAGGALLDDGVSLLRRAAGFEPGVAGAESWVAGEGELGDGGEDADVVVGVRLGRWQDEGRLREVRPVGEALHLVGGEAGAVEDDGDRVAAIRRRW